MYICALYVFLSSVVKHFEFLKALYKFYIIIIFRCGRVPNLSNFAVCNNFSFFLYSAEIPEWLVVYTKAPAEHDHKLKVGVCLICWGKHSYSPRQLGSGSVTCRQYTYLLPQSTWFSKLFHQLPRSDYSFILHTCPSASLLVPQKLSFVICHMSLAYLVQ